MLASMWQGMIEGAHSFGWLLGFLGPIGLMMQLRDQIENLALSWRTFKGVK